MEVLVAMPGRCDDRCEWPLLIYGIEFKDAGLESVDVETRIRRGRIIVEPRPRSIPRRKVGGDEWLSGPIEEPRCDAVMLRERQSRKDHVRRPQSIGKSVGDLLGVLIDDRFKSSQLPSEALRIMGKRQPLRVCFPKELLDGEQLGAVLVTGVARVALHPLTLGQTEEERRVIPCPQRRREQGPLSTLTAEDPALHPAGGLFASALEVPRSRRNGRQELFYLLAFDSLDDLGHDSLPRARS